MPSYDDDNSVRMENCCKMAAARNDENPANLTEELH